MKIRNEEDIAALDEKIKNDLGIDVRKYRNPEAIEGLVDLITFPKYAINWTIRPILLFFVFYIIGFFVIDLTRFEWILYALLGFVLFIASGWFGGLHYLISKIRSDVDGIADYSFDVMKASMQDLNIVGHQIGSANWTSNLGLLFKGVIHIVSIPVLTDVIGRKVPFVGRFLKGIVGRFLRVLSDQIDFDEAKLSAELEAEPDENKYLQIYTNSITTANKGTDKVLSFAAKAIQLPLKIGFIISFLFLALFIYLIW